PTAGTGGVFGALIRVTPPFGFRTLISNLGDPAFGPVAMNAVGVAVAPSGDIFLVEPTYSVPVGEGGPGRIFKVDAATGQRTVFSDFTTGPQHPINVTVAPDGSL